jgi:transcriptional regulator with XRE-family HTH domain
VLAFDTETRLSVGQELLVGAYLIAQRKGERFVILERGLFLPDGVPKVERRTIEEFARANGLQVLSRDRFARRLIQEGYEIGSLVVAFNLPFDLSRIAVGWGRGRKRYRDGFTLRLFRSFSAPPIRIRTFGTRQFIEWGSCRVTRRREGGRRPFKGRFLDLQKLTYALTGEKLTLEEASREFGVPYRKRQVTYGAITLDLLTYLLEDVEATYQLFLRLVEFWNGLPFTPIPSPPLPPGATPEDTPDLHPEAVLPHRLQSPAGIAKALLQRMGVKPFSEKQPDFPPEILGKFMSALYGGWGECRILGMRVPVRYLDISSTYLNLARLLHLWDVIAAEEVEVVDATEEVRTLVEQVELEDLYNPETWRSLVAVCLVEPDGDVLPVIANWGNGYLMALNPIYGKGVRMYWTLPDVIASKIRTGKPPRILHALRVVPRRRQQNLRPVRIWGYEISPGDPFSSILQARQFAKEESPLRYRAIKAIQEPLCYGIYAEMDDRAREGEEVTVYAGGAGYRSRSIRGERPGRYYHPFVAPFPPAACRLILAMMEAEVHRAGGEIARFATDAVYVVSKDGGGDLELSPGCTVHALSYEEVDRIREKFTPLASPNQPFWKLEPENKLPPGCTLDRNLYFIGFGTHRFTLGNRADDGSWIVGKFSMHSLGHLILPDGFAEELYREALARSGQVDTSVWAQTPALSHITLSRPDVLLRMRNGNGGRSPAPFSFVAEVPLLGLGAPIYRTGTCKLMGVEHTGCPREQDPCPYRKDCPLVHRLRGITAYVTDPRQATSQPVFDKETGEEIPVNWDYNHKGPQIYPLTLARYARDLLTPEERRYVVAHRRDGEVRGLLSRRPTLLLPHPLTNGPIALGPRSTLFELAATGEVTDEELLAFYRPAQEDALRAALALLPARRLARGSGMNEWTIRMVRRGRTRPRPSTKAKITSAISHEIDRDIHLREALRAHPNKKDLAKRSGVSRRTIYNILEGKTRPSVRVTTKLLRVMNVGHHHLSVSKNPPRRTPQCRTTPSPKGGGPRTRESAESCRTPTGKEEKKVDHDRPRAPYL